MNFLAFMWSLGLACAAACAGYRILCGPDRWDRILALDYLSIVGVGACILFVVISGETMALDIGICLALTGFLTAYLFSVFLSKKGD